MHKITSFEDDMRKFLSPKFWSHGTLLGSMGPGSQKAPNEIFSKSQILVIWGPYNCPVIVACREQAEKLNLASSLVCNMCFHVVNFARLPQRGWDIMCYAQRPKWSKENVWKSMLENGRSQTMDEGRNEIHFLENGRNQSQALFVLVCPNSRT